MLCETFHFFSDGPLADLLLRHRAWDPRFAAAGCRRFRRPVRPDPAAHAGTLYIALVSMLVAVPVGLMSAVYMAEYASRRVRSTVKPTAGTARRHPDHRLRHLRAW